MLRFSVGFIQFFPFFICFAADLTPCLFRSLTLALSQETAFEKVSFPNYKRCVCFFSLQLCILTCSLFQFSVFFLLRSNRHKCTLMIIFFSLVESTHLCRLQCVQFRDFCLNDVGPAESAMSQQIMPVQKTKQSFYRKKKTFIKRLLRIIDSICTKRTKNTINSIHICFDFSSMVLKTDFQPLNSKRYLCSLWYYRYHVDFNCFINFKINIKYGSVRQFSWSNATGWMAYNKYTQRYRPPK